MEPTTVSYNFRFNNMANIKQVHKEPYTQLPQTDPFPSNTNTSNTAPPSQSQVSRPPQKQISVKEEKSKDKTSLLKGLKMLFPSHPEESLRSALERTDYNMDDAITLLLEQNELANAPQVKKWEMT